MDKVVLTFCIVSVNVLIVLNKDPFLYQFKAVAFLSTNVAAIVLPTQLFALINGLVGPAITFTGILALSQLAADS